MNKIQKKKFQILNMHCSSCAMSIDIDLEDLDGVNSSKTSYAKQTCEVEYEEGKVNEKIIIEQIKKTGYSVKDYGGKMS